VEFDVARSVTEAWKVWIAGGAILLLGIWPLLRDRRARSALLLALTLFSCWNHARWGTRSVTERVDTYDLVHYYLNAKYFEELGYYDLYPSIILADHENDGPWFKNAGNTYMAQDAEGHALKPVSHALARGRHVKAEAFTPERWAAFTHDALHLQRAYKREWSDKLWRQMVMDHGFNGTTAWTLVAEPLTRVVPVEYIKWLCHLDLLLLIGMAGLITWAYGVDTALWLVLFLTASYSLRWPTVSWVFLRYDWVFALVGAMAFIKKGHPLIGGILAGWAATLRFFPAMWMWGPFAKGVAGLTRRHVSRPLLVLAAGFVLGVAVIQGAATARYGVESVSVHFENMLDHNRPEQLSSRRIGLGLGMTFDGGLTPKLLTKERKLVIKNQQPLRYGLSLLFLLVMGWGLRRSSDDEAYGFGFLPFFLLTTASYYYYVARATLAVLHAADLDRLRNRVGLTLLFTMELFSNWAEGAHPGHRSYLIGWLAWMLAAYALIMCVWVLVDARRADSTDAPADGAAAA
jgi:hypothetical protein